MKPVFTAVRNFKFYNFFVFALLLFTTIATAQSQVYINNLENEAGESNWIWIKHN